MKKRSKKYFNGAKANQTEDVKAPKSSQDNPAKQATSASQDYTGGGNDTGKRIDEN